jgi:hypothetical protein
MRIKHEASLHDTNSFITLTYNKAHLPLHGTLQLKDFQDFMKRLRKKYKSSKQNPIPFYHCGEYGENGTRRPHYHAIIFNRHITQPNLQKLWSINKQPIGHVHIGQVTFDSAAYVAGYVNKKINGPKEQAINMSNGLKHYERKITHECGTQEIITLKKEYATMSRRPGIGKTWFDKQYTDAYPSDFITIKGRKMRPPKYYDKQYEKLTKDQPHLMEQIKENRKLQMDQLQHLFTPEALKQKELNHKARMALYSRKIL